MSLLRHVDHAHPAFTDLLQEFVWADDQAGLFGEGLFEGSIEARRWSIEWAVRLLVGLEEFFYSLKKIGITGTSVLHIGHPLLGCGLV
jgi:hypothetical protein